MYNSKLMSTLITAGFVLFVWSWVTTVIFNVFLKFSTFPTVLVSLGLACAVAALIAKKKNITITRVVEG